ncbi:MAG: hypothetical protein ACLQBQ_13830, partial [Smithella sp.]
HKKIVLFFAAICLVSTLTVAFHHHHDECRHSDCPLCIVGISLSNSSIENNNTSFVFHSTISYFRQPEEAFHITLSVFSTYPNKAPPLSDLTA